MFSSSFHICFQSSEPIVFLFIEKKAVVTFKCTHKVIIRLFSDTCSDCSWFENKNVFQLLSSSYGKNCRHFFITFFLKIFHFQHMITNKMMDFFFHAKRIYNQVEQCLQWDRMQKNVCIYMMDITFHILIETKKK